MKKRKTDLTSPRLHRKGHTRTKDDFLIIKVTSKKSYKNATNISTVRSKVSDQYKTQLS